QRITMSNNNNINVTKLPLECFESIIQACLEMNCIYPLLFVNKSTFHMATKILYAKSPTLNIPQNYFKYFELLLTSSQFWQHVNKDDYQQDIAWFLSSNNNNTYIVNNSCSSIKESPMSKTS